MALAADLSPSEVAALDGRAWHALTAALEERWTRRDELAALTVELLHTLVRLQVKRPPPPFFVERPYERQARKRPATGRELAAALGVGPPRGER